MREGVTVGLIGAAVAVLLFLVMDLAAGAPLRTPALLGNALFHGEGGARDLAITMPVVLGYTAVHLAGFVLFVSRCPASSPWPSVRSGCSR
jgi:hypothetical protein